MAVPLNGCSILFIMMSIAGCLYCRLIYEAKNEQTRFEVETGEWDQFVLSLQWPFTACMKMGCSTKIKRWTIHGLWPGFSTKRDCPTGCPNDPFDDSITNFQFLKKYWPDLTGKEPSSFWKYEWRKHGQCALESDKIKDCKNYFRRTVKLREKYNPYRVLENNRIKPSKTKAYKGPKYYLGEIHLCFTKTLALKNCYTREQCGDDDEISDVMDFGRGRTYTDCPMSKSVYYPKSTRN